MTEKKKRTSPNWGGRRPGSGRKVVSEEAKRRHGTSRMPRVARQSVQTRWDDDPRPRWFRQWDGLTEEQIRASMAVSQLPFLQLALDGSRRPNPDRT